LTDIDGLRRSVLDGWSASPTRFREDANAEEDLLVHGYADRLLVELAQNAADAAGRRGDPGQVRIQLSGGGDTGEQAMLSVANTGAPLDAPGIAALTSLRASAKRDGHSAGRFGVGFVAVLAVSDEPEVRSTTGGIRFSADGTRQAVAGVPHLAAETARRGGRVPVLRLAWPVAAPPAAGFDTEIVLPLRPGSEDAVRAALAGFDPALLLALPALAVVEVAGRRIERLAADPAHADVLIAVDGVPTRWRSVSRGGELAPELVADRPVEERRRSTWSLTWAVPVADDGAVRPLDLPQRVHAPTVSDEPLSVPARLIGTFPLTADRRRVPPGPLADRLADEAGDLLVGLVTSLVPTVEVLRLVPAPQVAGAPLDARISGAAFAALRRSGWLRGADPSVPAAPVVPAEAVRLPASLAGLSELLAGVVAGLLHRQYGELPAGRRRSAERVLDRLGVRVLEVAELVEAVSAVERPPDWWARLYAELRAGLAADPTLDAEALAALPVPLADGRTVTGPGRVVLPAQGSGGAAGIERVAAMLGLRVAHPDAADELLERLGARPVTPAGLLGDERVRAAVETSSDLAEHDPSAADELADAVLLLVAAAPQVAGGLTWLGELALPAGGGESYPAGEFVLPGSPLDGVLVADPSLPRVSADLVDRHGGGTLAALGVMTRFAVVDESDVDLADLPDLPDVERWAEMIERSAEVALPAGPLRVDRLVAVRDLDLVRPDAWPAALAMLAEVPGLRPDCEARAPVGAGVRMPSYLTWWLSGRPVLNGRRPAELRTRDAAALDGLLDPPPGLPDRVALLAGCRASLADVLADPAGIALLLDRLADPARRVLPEVLPLLYAQIAALGPDVDPPRAVRVAPDLVADPDSVAVLDRPWLLPAPTGVHLVLGGEDPDAVAELLDVPLLSELGA
jgi:hypothetical protein